MKLSIVSAQFHWCSFIGNMQDTTCLGKPGAPGIIQMKLISSLFINSLPHHQNCWYGASFNENETPTENNLIVYNPNEILQSGSALNHFLFKNKYNTEPSYFRVGSLNSVGQILEPSTLQAPRG